MNAKKYLAALAIGATLTGSCSRDENPINLYNPQMQESQEVKKYSSLDELLQKDKKARNYRQDAMERVNVYAVELSSGADNMNPRAYSELEEAIETWHNYSKQRLPEQKGELTNIVNNNKIERIRFYTAAIVDEIIAEKINKEWKAYERTRETKLKQIYRNLTAEHPEKLNMEYAEFKDAVTNSLDNAKPENLDETIYSQVQKYLPNHLWTRKWFEHHIMKPFVYDGEWSKDKHIRDNIQMRLYHSGLIKLKEKSIEEFSKSLNK